LTLSQSMYTFSTNSDWQDFGSRIDLQQLLLDHSLDHIRNARWFGGKAYEIRYVRPDHCISFVNSGHTFYFFIAEIGYAHHNAEFYLIPLALADVKKDEDVVILANWNELQIVDATSLPAFHRAMFESVIQGADVKSSNDRLVFDCGFGLNKDQLYISSRNPGVDQSNSSIFFNEKYFMKIYRKLFLETNPEVEMLKFLTEEGGYANVPAYRGSLIWSRKNIAPVTFALMMYKIDAQKDNWATTGDELNDFLQSFIQGSFSIHEFVFEHVELLAKRTAEMHAALASETSLKGFKTEKFNPVYRAWLFDHLKNLVDGRIQMLQENHHLLDDEAKRMAQLLIDKRETVLKFFEKIKKKPLKSLRTRIHGDFHLGQVLYTGGDFIIIDFEGEPESSIADRKIKHSPLKDVAGMIRSFHYAVSAKLFYSNETKDKDRLSLQKAADRWFYLIRETFTETYLQALGPQQKLYANKAEINFLFLLHLLEKAIYEVGYELNGRPDWLKIPLKGIEQVINELEKYEG
jgi:maltokinase